ncbi:hypothetical protein HDU85_002963 [Gaertneriomyces sp. JEL0708]|nr:hypothetical protein HDU85_002963 [Gaertneriomyces sp. JEL0708]
MTQAKHLLTLAASTISSRPEFGGGDIRGEKQVIEEHILKGGAGSEACWTTEDKESVENIVRGCLTWKEVLRAVMEHFYEWSGEKWLKCDYVPFMILLYQTLLTSSLLLPWYKAVPARKAYPLVRYLLETDLSPVVRDVVETSWLVERHTYVQRVEAVEETIQMRYERGMVPRKEGRIIESDPFLLTVPNERRIPTPEIVSNVPKAKPIPKSMYEPPREQSLLDNEKRERRERAKESYFRAQQTLFAVAKQRPRPKASSRTPSPPASPPSKPKLRARPLKTSTPPEIKQTTTTILRESTLLRQQSSQQAEHLQNVLQTLIAASTPKSRSRSPSPTRTRLLIQLQHEQAYMAKQEVAKANRDVAKAVEQQKRELKERKEVETKELEEEKRRIRKEVRETLEAVGEARKKVEEEKAKIAQQTQSETAALLAIAAQEQEAEQQRKTLLIAQIRALESRIPPVGSVIKNVDLTSHANLGLLGEMSVIELQERLLRARVQEERMKEVKREEIEREKKEKERLIQQKVDEIERARRERGRTRLNQGQSRQMGSSLDTQKSKTHDPEIETLKKALEAKKNARKQTRVKLARSKPHIKAVTPTTDLRNLERSYILRRTEMEQMLLQSTEAASGDAFESGLEADVETQESEIGSRELFVS